MITNEEFIKRIENKLNEIERLFQLKNSQYSVDSDPLQAFRSGALLLYGNDTCTDQYEALKAYVAKHIAHIYNNKLDGPKVNESIKDVVTYFLIADVLYDLSKEGEKDA